MKQRGDGMVRKCEVSSEGGVKRVGKKGGCSQGEVGRQQQCWRAMARKSDAVQEKVRTLHPPRSFSSGYACRLQYGVRCACTLLFGFVMRIVAQKAEGEMKLKFIEKLLLVLHTQQHGGYGIRRQWYMSEQRQWRRRIWWSQQSFVMPCMRKSMQSILAHVMSRVVASRFLFTAAVTAYMRAWRRYARCRAVRKERKKKEHKKAANKHGTGIYAYMRGYAYAAAALQHKDELCCYAQHRSHHKAMPHTQACLPHNAHKACHATLLMLFTFYMSSFHCHSRCLFTLR